MKSCRECCYAALTGANLYCSINDCYVGELTCDDFEPIVKAKTNADRIRSMTDEELAKWITELTDCAVYPYTRKDAPCISVGKTCAALWIDWLKEEATDDA